MTPQTNSSLGTSIPLRAILLNTGWLYADQLLRIIVVFWVFGLTARYLGAEEFGRLSYALAFPGLFLPLAIMGLDYVVVRDLVRRPSEEKTILSTCFTIKCVSSFLSLGLTLGIAWLISDTAESFTLMAVASVSLLAQPLLSGDFFFQSRVASKYSALARTSACLIANLARLLCVHWHLGLMPFLLIWVLEGLLQGGILMLFLRRQGMGSALSFRGFDRTLARGLWAASWPLLLSDVAIACYLRLDQILLGHLASPGALGAYAACARLTDGAQFLCLSIIGSAFPGILKCQMQGAAAYQSALQRFHLWMAWIAVAIAVGFTLCAGLLAEHFLGGRFPHASGLLVFFAWANVFVTFIAARGKWFLAEDMQRHSLWLFCCGAALHVTGVLVLVPIFGVLGAGASFLFAQMAMVLFCPLVLRRTRPAAWLAWRCWLLPFSSLRY